MEKWHSFSTNGVQVLICRRYWFNCGVSSVVQPTKNSESFHKVDLKQTEQTQQQKYRPILRPISIVYILIFV